MFLFTWSVGTRKKITLKFIIQELLRLYNRDIYSNLTKTKALFMASMNKTGFNIDSLIIHSALNILIQNLYLVYQTYHQIH
jgi:hypothetical protein